MATDLEAIAQKLNAAQQAFLFRAERFGAPRNLWAPDRSTSSRGAVYLPTDSVIPRMNRIRKRLGSDYLFCVTALPLRADGEDEVYFSDGADAEVQGSGAPEPRLRDQAKVAILSTWELGLEGRRLEKAIANHIAIMLCDDLVAITSGGSDDDLVHTINTLGFYNDQRNTDHIAGTMRLVAVTESELTAAEQKRWITGEQIQAIRVLLAAYDDPS